MIHPNLVAEYAANPASFRRDLIIPGAQGPAKFGDVTADFQAKDFAALDPAVMALAAGRKPKPSRVWWERTKGASKDSDLAVILLWLLTFSPRPLVCQVGAADADQADELRKAAKGILRLNPWLEEAIEIQADAIINRRTESRCDILTTDTAGSHGARPDVVIVNELSHITKKEFVENLLENARKVPNGLAIIATNAGFVPSWQWDFRETIRASGRWYFSIYDQPAPWIDREEVEESRKFNPNRCLRLWWGQWLANVGDALNAADIDAAVTELAPMTGSESGETFFAGLDLGLSFDHSALCVTASHVGYPAAKLANPVKKVRLAFAKSWTPPAGGKVDLVAVRESVIAMHGRFRFVVCFYDPWQCALMAQECFDLGVQMVPVNFRDSKDQRDIASTVIEHFSGRSIGLYREERLLADLRQTRAIEMPYGMKLEWPKTTAGHGDLATAFVLSLLASKRCQPPPRIPNDYPLVWSGGDSSSSPSPPSRRVLGVPVPSLPSFRPVERETTAAQVVQRIMEEWGDD